VALWLRDADILLRPDWTAVGYYWAFSFGFAVLAFFALRIQDGMTRYFSMHDALDIAEAVLFAELMTIAALFSLTRLDGIPRSTPVMHGLLLVSGLIAVRILLRIMFSERDEGEGYGCRCERIILIGANPFAASFIQLLRSYAPQRQPVIAVLDEDAGIVGRAIGGVQVLGAPNELDTIITEFAIHGVATDRVMVAGEVDSLSPVTLREVEWVCQKRQINFCFLPRMIGMTQPSHERIVAANDQAIPSCAPGWFFQCKRALDIVGSLALIIFLLPLMALVAIGVMFDVGSPILFWQERVGWKGRSFLIYKFRTLKAPVDSDGKPCFAGRSPSLLARVLRASRIDEVPQLLNVLFGDMSLIGPRPLLPEDQPANRSVRLSVRPGITGWAQVNGGKLVSKEEKEKMDEWYIRNASLATDVRIMFLTLKMIFKSYLPSDEAKADKEQVQRRNVDLGRKVA
jgi:lipopolysaccharide/colanic/teichoic acid biosynthesis glycosyltransferase